MEGVMHEMRMVVDCSGNPLSNYKGGSWVGHFGPGVLLLIWATHWLLGVTRNYFHARGRGKPYTAQPFHRLFGRDRSFEKNDTRLCSEVLCKIAFPIIIINLEMWLLHASGWRSMFCGKKTARAGHFYGTHAGNWSHALISASFLFSGLVDLLGLKTDLLPPGAQHVCLMMSFILEALVMGLHKKHEAIDEIMHTLLFYAMLACAASIALEALLPQNLMASLGRCAALYLQGAQLLIAGHALFTDSPEWSEAQEDMGPIMMAPVAFVGALLAILVWILLVFVGVGYAHSVPVMTRSSNGKVASALDEEAGILISDVAPVDHNDELCQGSNIAGQYMRRLVASAFQPRLAAGASFVNGHMTVAMVPPRDA